jgi:hypothetical protein
MSNVATLPVADHAAMQADSISSTAIVLNDQNFERVLKFAEMMATAAVAVPQHLRGKPGDCLAIVMQATQWGMNPFAVAQKTHFVNGAIGYEAQLVNAVVQESGAIDGRFHYEYQGDGAGIACRVGAVIRGEREITWGEWLKASDVTTKNSPLWKTNPKQQLGYLQVKNWARLYCPGAILGVYTPDELEHPAERDMGSAEVVDRPAATTKTDALKSRLGASKKAAPQPPAVTVDQVLAAIAAATDRETMAAAKALGAQLPDGPDKDRAVAAYSERVAALKAAAEQAQPADPQTGEITDPQDDFLASYDAASGG